MIYKCTKEKALYKNISKDSQCFFISVHLYNVSNVRYEHEIEI